jgi:hypothetical protein
VRFNYITLEVRDHDVIVNAYKLNHENGPPYKFTKDPWLEWPVKIPVKSLLPDVKHDPEYSKIQKALAIYGSRVLVVVGAIFIILGVGLLIYELGADRKLSTTKLSFGKLACESCSGIALIALGAYLMDKHGGDVLELHDYVGLFALATVIVCALFVFFLFKRSK